jgi:hypothetical protein
MPFIHNCSDADLSNKVYPNHQNGILITITNEPLNLCYSEFYAVHEFTFLDLEDGEKHPLGIQPAQAKSITEILKNALALYKNVIVNCTVGISRSGAIAQFGLDLGFETTHAYKDPNLQILKELRKNE